MILYLDTSALAKLYVAEDGSTLVRDAMDRAHLAATCEIAYLELRSALARRHRERLLRTKEYRLAVTALESDWPNYFVLAVGMPLVRDAASTAERYGLRAYDALHLAACMALKTQAKEQVTFACWDRKLANAGSLARLDVLHDR